jgi:sucrose-6-phosphatase
MALFLVFKGRRIFKLQDMETFSPNEGTLARVLATDMDGTLIPLPGATENQTALSTLRAARESGNLPLIFATGRQYASIQEAIALYALPVPEWMVADVGSGIYRQTEDGEFVPFEAYATHLREKTFGHGQEEVLNCLSPLKELEKQSAASQTEFKTSYYCRGEDIEPLLLQVRQKLKTAALPYSCMGSIDPHENFGFIDVLPLGVSKSYALLWLATHAGFDPSEIVYAGDSGNDEAALISGFRAILVANATQGLLQRVDKALAARHLQHRLFHATQTATSGVLEGCQHFGILK